MRGSARCCKALEWVGALGEDWEGDWPGEFEGREKMVYMDLNGKNVRGCGILGWGVEQEEGFELLVRLWRF